MLCFRILSFFITLVFSLILPFVPLNSLPSNSIFFLHFLFLLLPFPQDDYLSALACSALLICWWCSCPPCLLQRAAPHHVSRLVAAGPAGALLFTEMHPSRAWEWSHRTWAVLCHWSSGRIIWYLSRKMSSHLLSQCNGFPFISSINRVFVLFPWFAQHQFIACCWVGLAVINYLYLFSLLEYQGMVVQ